MVAIDVDGHAVAQPDSTAVRAFDVGYASLKRSHRSSFRSQSSASQALKSMVLMLFRLSLS